MSTSRYTVRRLGWYQPPHGDPYTRRLPVADAVETFSSFDVADDYRRELEAEARDGENPFRFGGCSIFFQSSLDGPRLHDWLMDAGIEPPASELRHADWRAWWDAFAHIWNEEQLAHAWAAFDKVRFYEVVEAAPYTAHAHMTLADERVRSLVPLRTERGQLTRMCRRRTSAPVLGVDRRARRSRDEVIAIPSDVPMFAGMGFLVQRRVVLNQTFPGERNDPPANVRTPLALFAERGAAESARDRFALDARQSTNPFVFIEPAHVGDTAISRGALDALGLPLPVPSNDRRADWLEWYDLCQDESTDEQRGGVWAQCYPPLFEVLPVEVRDE